jgi:hypothetical protein
VILSGTGGGFDLDKAAVLSRHGFATLALAYFGISPLPTWLHRIPLEYFQAALGWLRAQPEIDAQRIGVLGISRGAELALLLGAKFPEIHAVAAYAPSSVAWAAGGRDKATGEIIPSWTWQGSPVPFAPLPLRGFMWSSAIPVAVLRRPVMFRNLFRAGLRNREAIERASIPVERMRGPDSSDFRRRRPSLACSGNERSDRLAAEEARLRASRRASTLSARRPHAALPLSAYHFSRIGKYLSPRREIFLWRDAGSRCRGPNGFLAPDYRVFQEQPLAPNIRDPLARRRCKCAPRPAGSVC